MKINRLFLILGVILLFCIGIVTGIYEKIGTDNNGFYLSGNTQFNDNALSYDTYTKSVSTAVGLPYVSDLDNDTVNEIIVIDKNNIRLYHPPSASSPFSLSIVDSFTVSASGNISSVIIQDMNGDGLKEIIGADKNTAKVFIVNYNGTAMYLVKNHTVRGGQTNGEYILNCESANKCIVLYNKQINSQQTVTVNASFFNYTVIGLPKTMLTHTPGGASATQACLSTIPVMPVDDIKNDGNQYYVSSWIVNSATAGQSDVKIISCYINSTNIPVVSGTITEARGTASGGAYTYCRDVYRQEFTSPYIADIDGSSSNGKEIVIGFSYDADEFKMYSYTSLYATLDDYPETFVADGIIVSNVIESNSFTDTGRVDFCVMGYQQTLQIIDLLCASEQTGTIPETKEFDYDYSGEFNVSTRRFYFNAIHSLDAYEEYEAGTDLTEILTPYGIFKIDYDFANELIKLWTNPKSNTAVMMSDADDNGYMDVIAIDSANVWYFDDGFTNSAGLIDEYYINPCLNSVWKLNTSAEVRVTVTDADGDNVRAKAELYQGTVYEQDTGWANYSANGATFPFMFTANKTITNGILRISATDEENPLIIDTYDFTISVATNGVVWGDCSTTLTGISSTNTTTGLPIGTPVSADPTANNTISNSVNSMASKTGLGTTILWVLVMLAFAVVIFVIGRGDKSALDDKTRGVIIVFGEVCLLIIGVKLQMISYAILWTLILLSVLGAGFWVSNKFFHGTNNNGG